MALMHSTGVTEKQKNSIIKNTERRSTKLFVVRSVSDGIRNGLKISLHF